MKKTLILTLCMVCICLITNSAYSFVDECDDIFMTEVIESAYQEKKNIQAQEKQAQEEINTHDDHYHQQWYDMYEKEEQSSYNYSEQSELESSTRGVLVVLMCAALGYTALTILTS